MAPKKCTKCQVAVTGNRNNPGISCEGTCNGYFHIACADIPADLLDHIRNKTAAWICNACKSSKRRSIIDGTESTSDILLNNSSDVPEILKILSDLRTRIINVENSQQYVSNSFDNFLQQIKAISDENKVLKDKINQLESKQSFYEYKFHKIEANLDSEFQRTIQNDVVISGFPSDMSLKNEMVSSLLRVLDVKADNSIIQSSFFVNHNDQQRTGTFKKPMLIIKTQNNELKNDILLKYKTKTINKNYIRTSDLGINWPSSHKHLIIRIMDHLSPLQTKLYAEAKSIKQKLHFKYLWCKQGKILLRKDSDSIVYHINSMNDINYIQRTFLGRLNITVDDTGADSN